MVGGLWFKMLCFINVLEAKPRISIREPPEYFASRNLEFTNNHNSSHMSHSLNS